MEGDTMPMSDTQSSNPCEGGGGQSTGGGNKKKMRERPEEGCGRGSQLAVSKRLERAERKRAQAAAEAADDEDSSMWELKYSFQDPVGVIRITEDWSGEGNGIAGLQWLGGVFLSRYMDSRQVFPEDFFVGQRIIEVGAGCGLTSIYLAIRGAEVTITDMDIDKCLGNVETNLAPRGLTGNVCVRRLKWGSAEDLSSFNPPYDVVVAGDCLYEEACITPLLETMWELAGPDTDIFLCGVVGYGILESFLRQVDTYFSRALIDASKVDTLANVQGMKPTNSTPATRVDPPPATTSPICPSDSDPDKNFCEATTTATATMGRSANGGQRSGGADAAERPGQRALLWLRKKMEVDFNCVFERLPDGILPTRSEPSGEDGGDGGV